MPASHQQTRTGRCLCQAVSFRVSPPLRPIDFCHCRECRRQFGDHAVFTGSYTRNLAIAEAHDGALGWYDSSDVARRGFCRDCGTPLFYQRKDMDWTSISAGALDETSGLKLGFHIFVAEQAGYDTIGDGRPCHNGFAGPSQWDL